ncbi:MAG TPA: YidB family protein [Acidobacteriaceae bacterium]
MGILDSIESLAGGAGQQGGEQAGAVPQEQQSSVSRALLTEIQGHPGGVGGMLDQFRQNGMGSHVDSWVNSAPGQGVPQQLSPQQVEQGTGSSMLGSIAQRTGLPPQAVTMALTTVLPLIMQHMTPNGQIPGQGEVGGMAQGLLSKLF